MTLNLPVSIELFDAFGAGIYLLFGVIHLDLWLKRRERPSHLWLASASAGALLVDLTGMALRGSGTERGILPTLNLLGVVIVTASVLELVLSLGNQRSGLLARAAYLLLTLCALWIGLGGFVPLLTLFFFASTAILLWALARAHRAGKAGDRESRAIAGGLVILIASLVIDVLGEVHVIPLLPGIPIVGFTALFIVSARALNGRYQREHKELQRCGSSSSSASPIARASCATPTNGWPRLRGRIP